MATEMLMPGMIKSNERAIELTRKQIEAALQLNSSYFDGEGLDNFPAILQALATNYHATVLYGKSMK